jgi:hypothetical protein
MTSDCESGINAAPAAPCSRRKSTSWVRSCERPHNTEATVNVAVQVTNSRLRPKRAAIQPTGAVMIAAATM